MFASAKTSTCFPRAALIVVMTALGIAPAPQASGQIIVTWGQNNSGVLSVPASASNVVQVAAGGNFSLALRADSTVVSWGALSSVPAGLTNVSSIAAGVAHGVALRTDGSVVAWGGNTFGQTNVPPEAVNVVMLAAGYHHNLALRADGVVIAWGKNSFGQTDVPLTLSNVVAISAGMDHSLAITADGQVVAWGGNTVAPFNAVTNAVPRTVNDLIAISAGASHNLGLRANGRLFIWGDLNSLPNPPAVVTNIVAITAATNFNLALRADGRLFGWGSGVVTNVPPTVYDVVSFGAGTAHAIALRWTGPPRLFAGPAHRRIASVGDALPLLARVGGVSNWISQWFANGSLVATGTNLARPSLPTPFSTNEIGYQVVVTNNSGVATSAVAQVRARWLNIWGDNISGQREIPAAVVTPLAIAAGGFHNLALQEDGAVVAWGKNSDGQTDVPASATNVVALAGGSLHSLALRQDGSVVGWGRNWDGQTTVPPGTTNVISVAAGYAHSLALRADGSVVAWGNNEFGQGLASYLATEVIAIAAGYYHNLALHANGTVASWGLYDSVPDGLSNVVAVAAGAEHSLALRADGTVAAWGGNTFGQTNVPPGATNVVAIRASYYHNVALRADGTVVTWGKNVFGNTDTPPHFSAVNSIAIGEDHVAALVSASVPQFGARVQTAYATTGGPVVLQAPVRAGHPRSFQWYHEGNLIVGATNEFLFLTHLDAAASGNYVLAVTNAFGQQTSDPIHLVLTSPVAPFAAVGAWGDGLVGQTAIPAELHDPRAVAAGAFHGLALQADGIVRAWGKNSDGQTNVPPTLTNAIALAGGSHHSLALKANGTVVAWGRNWSGQTNVPPQATNVVAIAAGYAHSLALRADGTLVAWGDNEFGQAAVSYLAQDVVAIAAGYYHNLALRADGRVVAWGLGDNVPAEATGVTAIAAGWRHSLALRADGTVVAWGDNTHGQSTVPSAATNVLAVAAGWYHSMALRADGEIVVWGRNAYSIAGSPAGLLNAARIATGEGHGLVLVNWGVPGFSFHAQQVVSTLGGPAVLAPPVQTSLPATFQWYHNGTLISGATNRQLVLSGLPTSASGSYVLAVTNSIGGALSPPIQLVVQPQPATLTAVGAWGDDLLGQTFIPPTLTNPREVAAGAFHSLALQADGTVVAWGKNTDGQTNVPPALTNVIAIVAGADHSLALQANGHVVAWGRNGAGQTNVPPAATNVIAIAAGVVHSVALRADGSLLAWGGNNHRQTQLPDTTNRYLAVAAGYYHTLALRTDHQVVAWGSQQTVPATASNVVALAAGWEHSLGLRADGSVVAWGDNSYGQCNIPAAVTNVVSIAAGYGYSVAQRLDGAVLAWGTGAYGITNVPVGLQNVARVGAGEHHVVILVERGPARFVKLPQPNTNHVNGTALFCAEVRGSTPVFGQWFQDGTPLLHATNRQLLLTGLQLAQAGDYVFRAANAISSTSNPPVALSVLASPAISSEPRRIYHPPGVPLHLGAMALGVAPLHYQWRFNGVVLSETVRISGTQTETLTVNPATYGESGDFSLVVSNAFGMVTGLVAQVQVTPIVAWGDNFSGQLEIPAGLSNVVAVSAGAQHNLALRADGSVVGWGDNSAGQTIVPTAAQNSVAVAAGETHSLALLANGTVVAWGDNTNGQCNIPASATNLVAIAAGEAQSVALRADGAVLLWGRSVFGQPNVSQVLTTNAVAISADARLGLFLRPDGTMSPTWLGVSNLVALDGGGGHTLVLMADGALSSAGNNFYGQRDVPEFSHAIVNFSAGEDHNVVRLSDGAVIAWGANFAGQTNVPPLAQHAGAVSAGGAHSLALLPQDGVALGGLQVARTAALGGSALLVAQAQSPGTAYYQWQFNGTNMVGATNAWLRVAGIHWTNAGNYHVVISNALGVVEGSPVALTVVRTPLVFATDAAFGPSYSNEFRARLLGVSGTGPSIIYASTNLVDWFPLQTNAPTIGVIDFVDTAANSASRRFYRATEPAAPPEN